MPKVISTLAAAAALAAVCLLACGEEVIGPPLHEDPGPNTTPRKVIQNVEWSLLLRDYHLFTTCLAPEFTYYGNPGGGKPAPPALDYAATLNTIHNIFEYCYAIRADIPAGDMADPEPDETEWRGALPLDITVLTTPGKGYRVGGGYGCFEIEKYLNAYDNKYYWRITKWWDYTRAVALPDSGPGIEPVTLGQLLALYDY